MTAITVLTLSPVLACADQAGDGVRWSSLHETSVRSRKDWKLEKTKLCSICQLKHYFNEKTLKL